MLLFPPACHRHYPEARVREVLSVGLCGKEATINHRHVAPTEETAHPWWGCSIDGVTDDASL